MWSNVGSQETRGEFCFTWFSYQEIEAGRGEDYTMNKYRGSQAFPPSFYHPASFSAEVSESWSKESLFEEEWS